MVSKLKLGLVGADAAGEGWGPAAHIPAIRGLDQIELAALCTSRPDSAAAAAEAYGVDRAYHDINKLVSQQDIDIIAVVVKIPSHHGVVIAALKAGKHVYCEWPLGADLAETEEMTTVARSKDVVTAIGLQGRHTPSLTYIKELYAEGWLGDILTVQVTFLGTGTPERPSRHAWERERSKGVTLLNVVGGHTLDYIGYCFGPLAEVSAKVTTRVSQLRMADTGEMVNTEAADNVLITGVLTSGAVLSYQLSAVPYHADGWRMAVFGSKGTIIASSQGLPQITPVTLRGAQGGEPLNDLSVPERLRIVPKAVPSGPPQNVGQAYASMAKAIRTGNRFDPSFEEALEVHKLLEVIQRSSNEGRAVTLG